MSDYISRKAAVDALTKVALRVADSKRRTVATCINEIELLPAADVEPVRRGQWILRKEHIYLTDGACKEWYNFFCSECDAPNDSPTCFCPSCGSKMDLEGSDA